MPPHKNNDANGNGSGLESVLWESANKLRNNMDAAEYKHVVLGLIFLKYVSDVFEARRAQLEAWTTEEESDYFMPTPKARAMLLESRDEYTSAGVLWAPEGNSWSDLRAAAKQNDISARIDTTMDAPEKRQPHPQRCACRRTTPAEVAQDGHFGGAEAVCGVMFGASNVWGSL